MRKLLLLLALICSSNLFAGWQNIGNCDRISAYTSNITKFIIDKQTRYVLTIDTGNIIKKWVYATGENIWSKQVKPDVQDEYTKNYTFLSSDGATYLTFALNFSLNNSLVGYVYIHDIETDVILDSLKYPDFPIHFSTYCGTIPLEYFADYISKSKYLITYINIVEKCQGPYTSNVVAGTSHIFRKSDTGFVDIANLGDYDFSKDGMTLNENQTKIIFQCTSSDYYFKSNYRDHSGSTLTNGVFLLDSLKQIKISNYVYSSDATYPNPPKITEIGTKMPFSSIQFGETDSNLFFLSGISLYKYDLYADSLTKINDLTDYSQSDRIQLCEVDKWLYLITKNDRINIQFLYNPSISKSLKVDSIKYIALTQNSKDNYYLLLTDSIGNLYRIKYYTIMDLLSVNEHEQRSLDISPNPTTNYIEIHIPVGVQLAVPNKIEIYDIMGKRIQTTPSTSLPPLQTEGEFKIDVSGLMPGVYFVKCGDRVSKFIKI